MTTPSETFELGMRFAILVAGARDVASFMDGLDEPPFRDLPLDRVGLAEIPRLGECTYQARAQVCEALDLLPTGEVRVRFTGSTPTRTIDAIKGLRLASSLTLAEAKAKVERAMAGETACVDVPDFALDEFAAHVAACGFTVTSPRTRPTA